MLLFASPFLMAQEEEDWSFPVKISGQRPVITDFVSAILSREDIGESLGEMEGKWCLYQAGKALPEGRSFLVDVKNGYLCYDATDKEEDGTVYGQRIEFCYWNCSDGRHKLVAGNTVCYMNGEPFMGQFSGLDFYLYDGNTRRMDFAYPVDLGADVDFPETADLVVHQLPRTGKTIEFRFRTPSGDIVKKITWNGARFVPVAE